MFDWFTQTPKQSDNYTKIPIKSVSSYDFDDYCIKKIEKEKIEHFDQKSYLKEHEGQICRFMYGDFIASFENGRKLIFHTDPEIYSYLCTSNNIFYMINGHTFRLEFVLKDDKITLYLIDINSKNSMYFNNFQWVPRQV